MAIQNALYLQQSGKLK